ncbi:MAG: glucose/arabinose dehydrogenase/predicted TIM-barrel fold metal-dependent hydrolase [Candidatus Latescibacterota bacterium]|jgi:glucose/arabinose dehydrogenase/predicted TIM-barrel fold metal-dependent hydrolase
MSIEMRFVAILFLLFAFCGGEAHAGDWPKEVRVYRGSTPSLDGVLSPGEYDDAMMLEDFSTWMAQFNYVDRRADLHATVWIKHDGQDLYFAFDVSDDIVYGEDIDPWLPADNPAANDLTREGWPWFGDGVEILLNASYRWNTIDGQDAWGDGTSWQMVASAHKSRLGGIGEGGLLEGEPRSRDRAWANYTPWIEDGAMQSAVRIKDKNTEGSGYVIEWKIRADPCLEIRPDEFWSPELGEWKMGLNLAVGDLDEKADGAGNFGNFHHENWWAGERDKRTWLKQWGTMILVPGPMPAEPEGYARGTIQLTPRLEQPLVTTSVQVPKKLRGTVDEGLTLNLPPGFKAQVFAAKGLRGPRFMAWSPDGVLHVANMKTGGASQFGPPNDGDVVPPLDEMTGQIVALPDRDGDGVADTTIVVAENLWWANSLQFYKGDLYVGDRHAVRRFGDIDGDGIYETEREPLALLPPSKHHRTRTILFDKKEEKLYVSVGSSCDLCWEEDSERAAILQFNSDGSGRRVFATGLRNATGLALHPLTNELWATDNGHDKEGRSLPPEMIDIIRDGGFYGWPLAYGYGAWTDTNVPSYNFQLVPLSHQDSLLVASMQRPAALLPAHLAPMDIHFYSGENFPARYLNAAFVALRGGSNAPVPGYRVVTLFGEADGSNTRVADFVSGFSQDGQVWGKPVGITSDSLGHMYVSSDWINHLILRISAGGLGGHWLQTPPSTALAGDVLMLNAQIVLSELDPEGGPAEVTANLSDLGGPLSLPFIAINDSTYRLATELTLGDQAGRKVLRINITQQVGEDLRSLQLLHSINVTPSGDQLVFGDADANGWQAVPIRPDEVDLAARGQVVEGESAIALSGKFRSIVFEPPAGFDLSGYTDLAFSFHPGEAILPDVGGLFSISGNADANVLRGHTIQLLKGGTSGRQYHRLSGIEVDLALKEWQEVVIPLGEMRLDDGLKWIRFLGGFDGGSLYIDNLRFVAPAVEQRPEPTEPVVIIQPSRIIDTHIHLFDPSRPEGVPWPGSGSELYRPTLPADFRAIAEPAGVTGAVVVEASAWVEDNQWLLDQTRDDPFFQGIVGNLELRSADFADHLARLASDKRFVGIRTKGLKTADLDEQVIADLRALAAENLVLDILMAGMTLADAQAIAEAVPELRLILNHVGGTNIRGGSPSAAWMASIQAIAQLPNVYCKVSGLFQQSGKTPAPLEVEYYRPVLDVLWQAFGEDRLIYGSNWPVSNLRGDYAQHQELVLTYLSEKGEGAVEKSMWKNAVTFYGLDAIDTAVEERASAVLPESLQLVQNFPNPFNGSTVFRFALSRPGEVELAIYNLAGQRVATLEDGAWGVGTHSLSWDGRDESGRALGSGVYFYRLKNASTQTSPRKLLLLR